MAISLFSHNAPTYEAAVFMFADTINSAIIHHTGFGGAFPIQSTNRK